MSEPIRLLAGPGDSHSRDLLASARDDQAPPGGEERALAMLGLGASVVATAATTATTATTATSTGASFAPVGASSIAVNGSAALKITGLAFVKWIGVGVVAMAAAAGTYEVVTRPTTRVTRVDAATLVAAQPGGQASKPARVQRSNELAAKTIAPIAAAPEEPSQVELAAAAVDTSHPLAAATPLAQSGSKPSSDVAANAASEGASGKRSGLAGELSLLDKARGAIAQHDASGSAAALDEYARRYPNGTMREEATVARIETLLLAGQTAQASAQADQFLREHPSSTNTKRVRLLRKRADN